MYWLEYEDQVCHFYHIETRKARKGHKCLDCGEKIPVGVSYRHFVAKWDDEFSAWDVCSECEEDWHEVIRVFHDNGERDARIIYGLLAEAIQDALDASYLKSDDPLVQKWLDIPEEEEISEEEMAISQMRTYSRPLL